MRIQMEPLKSKGSSTFSTGYGATGAIMWLATIVLGGVVIYVVAYVLHILLDIVF